METNVRQKLILATLRQEQDFRDLLGAFGAEMLNELDVREGEQSTELMERIIGATKILREFLQLFTDVPPTAKEKEFADIDRRVRHVEYDDATDQLRLYMVDGIELSLPRKYLQGLEDATTAEASQIEIIGNGTGLHWPRLNVDHYVLGLVNGILGTKQWMARLGRRGS